MSAAVIAGLPPDKPAQGSAELLAEHEALIQFVYLAPVGLVQASLDGAISMMNPVSAQLLMPLASNASLDNLFDTLAVVAPDLRALCAAFPAPSGMICDGRQIFLRQDRQAPLQRGMPEVLSLSMLKLDAGRLMAVIYDVSAQLRRERQLQQTDALLDTLITHIADYAVVRLDGEGRVGAWNPSIGRVAGFAPEIVGQPYSVFFAEPPSAERQRERLRAASTQGWHLEQATSRRADGSQFYGSAMISPLPASGALHAGEPEAAYCMILRELKEPGAPAQPSINDLPPLPL